MCDAYKLEPHRLTNIMMGTRKTFEIIKLHDRVEMLALKVKTTQLAILTFTPDGSLKTS